VALGVDPNIRGLLGLEALDVLAGLEKRVAQATQLSAALTFSGPRR
jgi:hypothetical protein